MKRLTKHSDNQLDEILVTGSVLLGLKVASALIFAYGGYKRYKRLKDDIYKKEGNSDLDQSTLLNFVDTLYTDSKSRAKKDKDKEHLDLWKANMDKKIKSEEIKSIRDFEDENKSFNSLSNSLIRKVFDSADYDDYVTEGIINPKSLSRLGRAKANKLISVPKVDKSLSVWKNLKKASGITTVAMALASVLGSLGNTIYLKKKYGDMTISKAVLKKSLFDIKTAAIAKSDNDLQTGIIENWYVNKLNKIEKGKITNITQLVSGNDWVKK